MNGESCWDVNNNDPLTHVPLFFFHFTNGVCHNQCEWCVHITYFSTVGIHCCTFLGITWDNYMQYIDINWYSTDIRNTPWSLHGIQSKSYYDCINYIQIPCLSLDVPLSKKNNDGCGSKPNGTQTTKKTLGFMDGDSSTMGKFIHWARPPSDVNVALFSPHEY